MARKGVVISQWKRKSDNTTYALRSDGKLLWNYGFGWELVSRTRWTIEQANAALSKFGYYQV